MGEDGRAVALDVLIKPDAGAGLGHDRCERGLADFKRIAPQVVAVQFDQVEGIEEDALVSAVVTDEIERGNAVVIACDSFAVDEIRKLLAPQPMFAGRSTFEAAAFGVDAREFPRPSAPVAMSSRPRSGGSDARNVLPPELGIGRMSTGMPFVLYLFSRVRNNLPVTTLDSYRQLTVWI